MSQPTQRQNSESTEMNSDTSSNSGVVSLSNGTSIEQKAEGMRDGDLRLEINSGLSLTDLTLEDAVMKIKVIEQANLHLVDKLRINNDQVKKQYDALRTLRTKGKERDEQTKALITALRGENEELQEKVLNMEDNTSKLEQLLKTAEETNAYLQLELNQNSKPESQNEDLNGAVYVSVDNQEDVVAQLKTTVSAKEECISLLQADLSKHKEELVKSQESARQLLKDLESQQLLKKDTDEENRHLNEQLVELNKKLHEQMHLHLSSTKRELEARQGLTSVNSATADSTVSTPSLLHPESLDDLIERAQSMEEAKCDEKEELNALLQKEMSIKKNLEKKVQELAEKVKELSRQNNEAMQSMVTMDRENSEKINQLCQDYEAKLTEMAKQDSERQHREPANTEDISVMRSQILSLVNEVNETQRKLSDATKAIHHKDEKIAMLCQQLEGLQKQNFAVSHDNQLLIQHLEAHKKDQIQSHEAYLSIQQQNKQLQISFDKLFTDYESVMNLLDTFKAQMHQQEQAKLQHRYSNEDMEELNRLTAEVIAAEEALALKDEQLMTARGKINTSEEDMEVLRIQAETYKTDFSCEREARTKLAEEKEEILEALKKCQAENQNLKEEMREINQRQITELQHRINRRSFEASYAAQPEEQGPPQYAELERRAKEIRPMNPRQLAPVAPTPPRPQGQGIYWPAATGSQPGPSMMTYDLRPNTRPENIQYPVPERGQARMTEEEAGDNNFTSLRQYECPFCGVQFPDIDTCNLHVPDCEESR